MRISKFYKIGVSFLCNVFWERFYNICSLRKTKPNPVAKQINISSGIVTKWKNTGTLPNGETLIKLADALDCSVDYLLGRSDIPDIVTINNYELLNDQAKMLVADYIRIMAKDNKYRKAPVPSGTSFADTLDIAAFGGKASQTGVDEDDIITTT